MGLVFAVTLFISGMICGVVGVGSLLIWFLNDKTRKIERQIAAFPDLGPKNLPKQSPVIIKLPPTVGSAASATILQDSKQRKLICEVFEASGIVAADNNGMTDPFLKIKLNDQTVKTRTLMNTLTPKWGESFVLLVEDAQADKLEVQLFDGDKPKEPLGEISVTLAELEKDHPKDLYLPFQGMASTKQGKVKSQGELRLQLTLVDFNSDLPLSVKSKRDKKREKEARARDKDKDKDERDKEERRKEREERKKKDKEDRRQRLLEKKREEREKKERKREEKRQKKEEHSGESESSVRESESSSASLAMSRAATSTSLSFVSDLAASSASNTTNKETTQTTNSARSLSSKDSGRSLSARRDSVNSDAPFTEPSISEEESFASETGSMSARSKKHPDVNMTMKGWLEMKRDKTSPRPGNSTKEKLWFVLDGSKLKYYKTAPVGSDPLPLGVIDLSAAKVRKSRTKKKTFAIEIPVTHSNHVATPHVVVSPDTAQQDPVGKKDVQKRKYQLKAATKAMLDMWVSALQSRGVATAEERRDSRNGADLDVDSDSESAMLTAVTEVSDSDEEASLKSDEDSKSESSDKIDAVTGIKKEKNLTGSVPNLPLHSKISLNDSAPAMVSQSARLPITSRDSDPSLASTESSESRDDLQEAQVEFLEKELKDLDGEDVISESKAKELKIEPLQRVGADATSGAGGDWLNVFLGRIFRDMQTCQIFLEEIKTKVRDQFEKIPKRTFMGPVVLKNFDLGAQFFKFHNLRFMPTSTPEEVVGEALVTYEKGFGLTAACEFYVNWPKPMTAVIPLEVTVSIEKCIGTWHFRFPPEVNTRMEICFVAPPDIEFDFLITVIGRNTRLGMLPQLRRFLFGLVKKSLTNLFVYPSKLKLFIPLPARRADTVLENPLRQRPRMPASGRTVPSRRDRPDVRARKTIVARFVNEVLNQRRFDQLQDLFTEDCLVHGSSLAGAVHQGRDAVKQHILELQNAFPDLVFYVEDLVADGVNVFIRWLARGTHKGQLWDYPGTGEERLLRGSMMCKVKEGNQRITDMYFYWSISSVYSLL